jgi:hypothetical protein
MKNLLIVLFTIIASGCRLSGEASPDFQVTPVETSERVQLNYVKLQSFEISGCSDNECPDAISAISLLGEDTSVNFDRYYHVRIARADPIQFLIGWCTNDQALLDQNLERMEFVFTIDAHSYADHLRSQSWSQPGVDNSAETEYCYRTGAVIRNWDYGMYDVQFGYRIHAEIFDGWETYPPQDRIRYYSLDVGN